MFHNIYEVQNTSLKKVWTSIRWIAVYACSYLNIEFILNSVCLCWRREYWQSVHTENFTKQIFYLPYSDVMYYMLQLKSKMHFLSRRKKCLWLFVIFCKLQSKIHFTVSSTITPPWTFVVHVPLVKGLSSKAFVGACCCCFDLTRAGSGRRCSLGLAMAQQPGTTPPRAPIWTLVVSFM